MQIRCSEEGLFAAKTMKKIRMTAVSLSLALTRVVSIKANEQPCEQCLGGGLNAPIMVEIFSDFQCPACRALYTNTTKQVLKDYSSTDKVWVIYHEFPLAMHQYARLAARYSVATQKLGREQWLSVIDALYADQPLWSQSGNAQASVARVLSPSDYERVQQLMQEVSINQAIDRDVALGQKRAVQSTPTLFVSYLGKEQKVDRVLPCQVLKDFFDRIVK